MSSLKVKSLPGPSECAPKTSREIVQLIQRSLEPTLNEEGASTAIVTIGPDRPSENTDRARRVHFKQDTNGALASVDYYALGKWHVFHQATIGEMRYFRAGAASEGWVPADGSDGLENIKEDNPGVYYADSAQTVVLHVFGGIE